MIPPTEEAADADREAFRARRAQQAAQLNAYAARESGYFTVPAGIAGIEIACHDAYLDTRPCACGCLVRYSDLHGSWCLNCGN